MKRDPDLIGTLDALELRVIGGPQQGARAPLAAGVACVIAAATAGRADGADIVLREDQAPARICITPALTHALIEVQAGVVRLGEQLLQAGATTAWPRHARLRLGATVLAFGLACEDEWPDDAPGAVPAPAMRPADADGDLLAAAPARKPLRGRAEAGLAAAGAVVLLACGGSLWLAHVAAAPRPAAEPPSLASALQRSEFTMLSAGTGADGRPVLRGRLGTLAQRARLDAWVALQPTAPQVDVWVDEAIAREVTEVFRINGVAVQARAAGPGRVAAEAAERDAARLARAEEVVRRDVRGLEQLSLRNTAQPLPPPSAPVADDPNKRIASLVPGDPAYVVTVDGARYFVGALLPSGHRITRIAAQRVVLERDGQLTDLNF